MHLKVFILLLLSIYIISGCNKAESVFRVEFERSGCFASEKSELSIYKVADSILVLLYTNGEKVKEKKLYYPFQAIIPAFVHELQGPQGDNNCTTIDQYTVYIDGKTIKKTDGSCKWKGFDRLKSALLEIN